MFFMTSFYFSVADSLLPCRFAAVWLMKQELPENNTHLNSIDNTISCSCYQLKALMCVANLSRCFELTVSFFQSSAVTPNMYVIIMSEQYLFM